MNSYIAHPLSLHGEKKVLVPTDGPQSNFIGENRDVYPCTVVVVPKFLLRCAVESGQVISLKYSGQEIARTAIPDRNFN